MKSNFIRIICGAILSMMFISTAHAQDIGTSGGDFSGLPVDLLPPGARSLGLAGAFTAVADDATAAVANPAGLSNLSTTEVSLHLRNFDSDVPFLDPDAFDSGYYDFTGNMNKTYSDSGTDVSFVSVVKPFDNWVISAYYLNQLNFESDQRLTDVVYDEDFIDTYTNFNSVGASIEGFGASVAYRVGSSFSIGLTVQSSKLDLDSADTWVLDNYNDYEQGYDDPAAAAAQIIDRYTVGNVIGRDSGSDNSDSDVTFNVGLLWNVSQKWSLGLVYRQGAKYDLESTKFSSYELACAAGATIPSTEDCAFFAEQNAQFGYTNIDNSPVEIQVPDTITLGIAWRPTNTLLVSLDLNRIGYSDSTPVRNITQGFGFSINDDPVDSNGNFARSDFNDPAISDRSAPFSEEIKDTTTVHLGVEKVFRRPGEFMSSVTIRGGAFTVKDHDGAVDIDTDDTVLTAGFGMVLGGDARGHKQVQVDLGASFGDDSRNIILSGIYRF